MENFYKYKSKLKKTSCQNCSVVQSSVVQSKKKQFRISGKELKQFEDHFHNCGLSESAFIKKLIKEALDRREQDVWQDEVGEW